MGRARVRARGERTVRARRRYRGTAGIDRHAAPARDRSGRSRRADHHAPDFRCRRAADRRARMSAGAHGLGARLPDVARRAAGGALPARPGCHRLHAIGPFRHRAFCRWSKRERRPAGGRRRHPVHDPPAMPAGPDAALCRLRGLARAAAGARAAARRASAAVRIHVVLPAARRTISRLSGGGAGQRSAARASPL